MKNYFELSVNEKINLKQEAINVTKNKRYHFYSPIALSNLNSLQIHIILN